MLHISRQSNDFHRKILNVFKVGNWQTNLKSFGLDSDKILKGSAATKPSPKPLGSVKTDTETEGSVAH